MKIIDRHGKPVVTNHAGFVRVVSKTKREMAIDTSYFKLLSPKKP